MFATGEYDCLIFSQKLSSGEYFCVYVAGDNNVVGLIHTNLDSSDILDAHMTDEDVVDAIVYDMMEEMERKNAKIWDDSDYSSREEHILTLLRDISLRWGVVCLLPENMTA